MSKSWDTLIKNAKVFDGSGGAPKIEDIAMSEGKIAARGQDLDASQAKEVVDGKNLWAMPGFFDVHTHYDLELELAPGLPESVRHGTTSVVIANCSLGLAFGNQRQHSDSQTIDPIVDCYARVENIPKPVLSAVADRCTWSEPADYLEHLDSLALGPNVVTLLPHSMLRIEVMGFEQSISRKPSEEEISKMQGIISEAVDAGYVGMSTDALPFHYLANDPNREKTIPTQFADYSELKALTKVLREKDAVWQATPAKDQPLKILQTFLLSSARLHGKALKTTVVAALDVHANRQIVKQGRLLARLLNSALIGGKFYMQALAAPFKTWADGAITPLSEEIPELRELNEPDLEDREARMRLLNDPDFQARFKRMWMHGKSGFGLARWQYKSRSGGYAFNRELLDMDIDVCPLRAWEGLSFAEVFERLQHWQADAEQTPCEEADCFNEHFSDVQDEGDFVLAMLRCFDTAISWSTVSANRSPEKVRELIMDPLLLPGFNDCGAHLTNMAFYDGNLRGLKMAAEGGDADIAYMVKRLSRDPAEVFGVDAGRIDTGDQADLILINPDKLRAYDGDNSVLRQHRAEFNHEQLVNRSDGVVERVFIAGKTAWQDRGFSQHFGQEKMGRVLKPA